MLQACFDFDYLRYIVLDEADRLIENAEFREHILGFKLKLVCLSVSIRAPRQNMHCL